MASADPNAMTADAHSILAPSSAERAVPCPASVKLERWALATPAPNGDLVTADTIEAAEGIAAHWALAEMLYGREPTVGARAPNGVFLTDEMIEGADIMAEDVEVTLIPHGLKPTDGAIEVAVNIPRTHELCWGTPDYRVWLPASAMGRPTLALWDFKFGHRIVEVFENWQCLDYASGCVSATKLSDLNVDVIATIVQPRGYHRAGPVRRWRFNMADARGLVNIRSNTAHEALGPDPKARPGPHCRDCIARHACPTLQRAGYAAMDEAGKALPLELTPEAMGIELRMLREARKRIEARESGLEEQILGTIKRGGSVPGWAIEHGAGRQRWKLPDAHIIAVGQMLGINVAKPPEAVTPLQASKLGLPTEHLAGLIDTPRSVAKLVPDDGARARKVFG